MSEVVSSKPTKTGRRWLNIVGRILVTLLMLLAVLGFLISVAGIAGVWVARSYGHNAVIDVTSVTTKTLTAVNNGLVRVNTRVQDARQKVTQVNDAAANLGNRIDAKSPLVGKFNQLVNTNLAPSLEKLSTTAAAVHDAVVSLNSKLELLNRLPNIQVPTLTNQLSAVSDRAQEAQTAVQDLQTSLADVKSGLVTTVVAAVTQRTARIDAALARIQDTVNTYQATVTRTQNRVTAISNSVLLLIDVGVVSLTLLFIIFAIGLVLLLWVCWQFVRTGHFPSLRVVYVSNKGAVAPQVTAGNVVSEGSLKKEAPTLSSEVVEAEKLTTSEKAPAAEQSADMATSPEVVEAKETDTSKGIPKEEVKTVSSEVVEAEKPATLEEAPATEESVDPVKEDTASG
jgi:membrane protein implicated in regulation of membrane protease activity